MQLRCALLDFNVNALDTKLTKDKRKTDRYNNHFTFTASIVRGHGGLKTMRILGHTCFYYIYIYI